MNASYTRAERRRLERLGEAVERVTLADAFYFERFTKREYRLRVTASVELEQNAIVDRKPIVAPDPGQRWFTIVRQIVPGVRMRVQAQGPADHDVDLPEDVVRGLWSDVVKPGSYFATVERQMCDALARMGGAST